jgi:hypothetical protein
MVVMAGNFDNDKLYSMQLHEMELPGEWTPFADYGIYFKK